MKKIMVLSFLLMLSVFSFAQSDKGKFSEEEKKELLAKMEEYRARLNLSGEQEAKVEKINEGFFKELSALKQSDEGKLAKYRKFKSAKSNKDKQMKEVLNAEQYKIYQQMQTDMKKEMKKKRKS